MPVYISNTGSQTNRVWVCCPDGSNGGWATIATTATTSNYIIPSPSATATTTGSIFWEDSVTPDQYMALAQGRVIYCRQRTEQERRELVEHNRLAAEEHERRMVAHRIAKERSRELLLSHLTAEQRRTFESNAWFIVEGGRTRQRYRIHDHSYSANIHVLFGDRVSHKLCCHCSDSLPIYDHLLAQKLHLQYDEDAFLRTANRHAA